MLALHAHVEALLGLRASTLQQRGFRGEGARGFVGEAEVRSLLAGTQPDNKAAHARALATREDLDRAVETVEGGLRPLGSLGERLGIAPDALVLLGVLAECERLPVVHQMVASLSGDPIVDGRTALALCELVASGDAQRGRELLGAVMAGGTLAELRIVTGRAGLLNSGREPIALCPQISRVLRGERPEEIWHDASLTGRLEAPEAIEALAVDEEQVRVVRDGMRHAARADGPLRVLLAGSDLDVLTHLARQQAAATGATVLVLDPGAFGQGEGARDQAVRAARDATLNDAWLFVVGIEEVLEAAGAWRQAVTGVFAGHPGDVIFAGSRRLTELWERVPGLVQIEVPTASVARQVAAMSDALGGSDAMRAVAAEVAPRYTLRQQTIGAAAAHALAVSGEGGPSEAALSAAIRRQLESRLGEFADTVETSLGLDDLQMDEDSKGLLREMTAAYRLRDQVLNAWGFGARIRHARGVSALFSGPPGTGKTMAAGIIARELGTDLFQVDLSRVVDKYIGETEKHLGRIFDEAERGQVVLLFDEADSLFSKRTDVSRAADRYANLEVNFLLQRLERHEGIVVLTTNHEALIDGAFKRRLRYRIAFPMPDESARTQIWERLIPKDAPVDEAIDFELLGEQYEMSGGHIRNAIVRGAYGCAEAGSGLTLQALIDAADVEYQSMGKLVRKT